MADVLRTHHASGRAFRGFFWSLFLLLATNLAGCGNNPPGTDNVNYPYGMAIYSDSTTPTNSFITITSYGSHQVLVFPEYSTSTSSTYFLQTAIIAPASSLSSGLQGPDGLMVYPYASNIAGLDSFTPPNITGCYTGTTPALFVADGVNNAIYIYCSFNASAPKSTPDITIEGTNTQLVAPEGMSMDMVDSSGTVLTHPVLFVANSGGGGVLSFDLSQITGPGTYNISPSGGILSGVANGICAGLSANNTALNCPGFLYFSNQLKTLFVSNTGNAEVMIYSNGYCLGVAKESPLPTGCNGNMNIQPSARLASGNTLLTVPAGIVVYNQSLYVADWANNDIIIWDNVGSLINGYPTGGGAPSRKIGGPSNSGAGTTGTNFSGSYALTFDPNLPSLGTTCTTGCGVMFNSQVNNGQIFGFSPMSTFTGDNPPTYTISVTNPGLQ